MDKIITIPYKPHSGQVLLHADNHRFKTIVAGRRFGKTVYADNKLEKFALIDPGLYAYIAPTYSQAKLISWEILKFYSPIELVRKINESELYIEYVSGGIVRLFGADNPDRLRGLKLKGAVLDEFQDTKRIVWSTIIRPALTDFKGWADFIGTPKGKINQLYEMFIKDKDFADNDYLSQDGLKIETDSDYKSFIFKTVDNPYIDPEEVKKARQELAPQYFRQEYEASFENYTGIIYKEFDSRHIISIDGIKTWWQVFVGIDTGRHTAVTFLAIDEKGRNYIFDEIYNYDGIVKNIAAEIKHKLKRWGRDTAVFIIDSASQVKREYESNGIACLDSEKDVENQIAQVRGKFAQNLLFFDRDRCPMHIVEHKGYVWNEKAKKPEPLKENDHTCNSLQYIISTYAGKSANTPQMEAYRKTLAFHNVETNVEGSDLS